VVVGVPARPVRKRKPRSGAHGSHQKDSGGGHAG
jgi:hypothetical protein